MQVNKVIFILVLASFFSCERSLSPEEYVAWAKSNSGNLIQKTSLKNIQLALKYEPSDLLIAEEILMDKSVNRGSVKLAYDEFEHFQFQISKLNGGNVLEIDESQQLNRYTRVNYFTFLAKKDFVIIQNEDTLNCLSAHLSQTYNLSPNIDISLAFNRLKEDQDFQFIYNDTQFKLGKIKFQFGKELFADIPKLNLNETTQDGK